MELGGGSLASSAAAVPLFSCAMSSIIGYTWPGLFHDVKLGLTSHKSEVVEA